MTRGRCCRRCRRCRHILDCLTARRLTVGEPAHNSRQDRRKVGNWAQNCHLPASNFEPLPPKSDILFSFYSPVPVVYVLTVGAAVGEPLLAFRALERLLAAVEPSVFGEVVFVFESLLTIGAFVGTQV